MLTHQQILHFRTFGYVTLRGLLRPDEAAALRGEVDGALTGAFGPPATGPDGRGGISGDYLPLASERAPFSLSLIADDQRTFGASAELLGSPTVPSIGIATRFRGDSTWHTSQGPDVGGVTFWADLEPRTAGTGALRLIPGSHLPEFERGLWEYCAAEPAVSGFEAWEWPHVVIETSPGDVVAVHEHLRQCAQGGTPRLSWTIAYFPWPGPGGWRPCGRWWPTASSSVTRTTTAGAGRSGASGRRARTAACRGRSLSNGSHCSGSWAKPDRDRP